MKGWLAKRVESLAGRAGYETQKLMLGISERIVARMAEVGMNRSALAETLGKDRSQVTRLLNGNPNVTLKTLVEISTALGTRWKIDLADNASKHTSANDRYIELAEWLVHLPAGYSTSEKSWSSLEDTLRAYSARAFQKPCVNAVHSSANRYLFVRQDFREVVN
ncbi:helix-turn-helix protein [Candidatus Methylomirabilis lanthanidiphila]|uniref:Helix-turn-helix protein n=1 Tax=Candidatus Methylomirabilis lanthanidiphila TaxID=2211376 RepID=A0A564ZJI0_9BACT|nr:helix-turn-helix domain-containing protein [Candidatus Methylomirabilis lanthanidiphila]VUZ85489.1 helix-turn-helix protein [Candidatus Methylomirabilis lanthanidiphila]